MEKFLAKYQGVLAAVNWQLRSLPLFAHGVLVCLLAAVSYLLTFHAHFLVVVGNFIGIVLLFCAIYVGALAYARTNNEDDYVDID